MRRDDGAWQREVRAVWESPEAGFKLAARTGNLSTYTPGSTPSGDFPSVSAINGILTHWTSVYAPTSDYIPTPSPPPIIYSTTDPGAYVPTPTSASATGSLSLTGENVGTSATAYVGTPTPLSPSVQTTITLPNNAAAAPIITETTIPNGYLPIPSGASPPVSATNGILTHWTSVYAPASEYITSPSPPPSFPSTANQAEYIPTPSVGKSSYPSSYIPTSGTPITASVIGTSFTGYISTPGVEMTVTLQNDASETPPPIYSTTDPGAYIPVAGGDSSIPPSKPHNPTSTNIPGAYIPSTTTDNPFITSVLSTKPSAYIPTLTPTVGETQSNNPDSYIPTTPVAGTPSGAYIPTTAADAADSVITTLGPVSTYTASGIAMVVVGYQTKTRSPSPSLIPVSTITSNGATMVVYSISTPVKSAKPATTTPVTSGKSYSVYTGYVTSTSGSVAYVYMTTMTLSSATSGAAFPGSTSAGSSLTGSTSNSTSHEKPDITFGPMSYFTASYLPTLIAVAFRILWTIVYNNARLMEPFYRLVPPSGAQGKHALGTL